MKLLTILAITLPVTCTTLAQDDPIEARRFPIAFLTLRPGDSDGVSLGLEMDAIGTSVRAGESGPYGFLTCEDLVAMLLKDVAPESWQAPGASLGFRDGELVAINRRSVLAGVSAWLERARLRHGRSIVIEAALVVVPPAQWIQAEPRDLLQGATLLKSARLVAASGQRVQAQDLAQQAYLRDYDVQIATGTAALDPVVDVLNTGVRIELRPYAFPGDEFILMEVRSEAAALEALLEKTLKLQVSEATAGGGVVQREWEGLIQLPRSPFGRIRGQILARPGETVVAASTSRPDGVLALLLTPSFSGEPSPAAPREASTRLYDVGGLISRVQDWSGPRAELLSPSRGGGGPLTGARFTLDEPREGFGIESLKDELKAAKPGLDVSSRSYGTVAVRADGESQAAVGAKLLELFRREVRTLTTEAVVLSFKPAARGTWAKAIPGLGSGGTRVTDAEMKKLLQAAGAGAELRLAATLSVSGRLNQLVHVYSGRQESYIQDFEPQVSSQSACADPIIGVLLTGNGLVARPIAHAGDGSIQLEAGVWMLGGELGEDKRATSGAGPLQRPKVAGFLWEANVVCIPGQWTLAALESRGSGDAAEEFALFVRTR